jgi:hypothetical protein
MPLPANTALGLMFLPVRFPPHSPLSVNAHEKR